MATQTNKNIRTMQVYSGEEVFPRHMRVFDGIPEDVPITIAINPDVDDEIILSAEWIDEPLESEPAPPGARCLHLVPLCVQKGAHQPPCRCVLAINHNGPCTSVVK